MTNFDSSDETAQGIAPSTAAREVTPVETIQPPVNEKSLEGQGVEQTVVKAQSQSPQAIEPCSTPRSTPCSTSKGILIKDSIHHPAADAAAVALIAVHIQEAARSNH
ncbi:hypothetical protein NIES2111_66940 (plasmid) [Nostoc sp. NIES-2111]|nr:hypothetical protein NIES2111_66940 [Nostoc sp. NIES-2111]